MFFFFYVLQQRLHQRQIWRWGQVVPVITPEVGIILCVVEHMQSTVPFFC